MTDRQETEEDKQRVEMMTTAVLTRDPLLQAVAAEGLTPSEERLLRAGAAIIAGMFTSLAPELGVSPSKAWRIHMQATIRSRESRRQT